MKRRRSELEEDTDEYRELQQGLGKRLRRLRLARSISQRQLAELADISTTNYAIVEAGAGNVTLLILDRVARVLGVSVARLFDETPGADAVGVDGLIVRLVADLDSVKKQLNQRRDEVARFNDELQAFIDRNREALGRPGTTLASDSKRSDGGG
jgi:transcriptional regulator with XRE-family HTH domain